MSEILPDGHVMQDGLRFNERPKYPSDAVSFINVPLTAQVLDVYYNDDEQNGPGETILCDLWVTKLGVALMHVPFLLEKASVDNYVSYGPTPATGNVDQSTFQKLRVNPSLSNGDTVLVVFANGSIKEPYIIKTLPHNQSGFSGVCPDGRAGRAAGDHYKVRFNGTNLTIDKEGNLTIESTKTVDDNIPRNKIARITLKDPEKAQTVELKLDNALGGATATVSVKKESGEVQSVVLDAEAQKLTLTNTTGSGVSTITMAPGKVTIDVKGEAIISASGAANVTAGGAVKVTAGAACEVNASGDCKVTAGGKAQVDASAIELNGSAGEILTTATMPLVDNITGAPSVGVATVKAG